MPNTKRRPVQPLSLHLSGFERRAKALLANKHHPLIGFCDEYKIVEPQREKLLRSTAKIEFEEVYIIRILGMRQEKHIGRHKSEIKTLHELAAALKTSDSLINEGCRMSGLNPVDVADEFEAVANGMGSCMKLQEWYKNAHSIASDGRKPNVGLKLAVEMLCPLWVKLTGKKPTVYRDITKGTRETKFVKFVRSYIEASDNKNWKKWLTSGFAMHVERLVATYIAPPSNEPRAPNAADLS